MNDNSELVRVMSFMYNKKSRGPKMDPCGTPHLTDKRSDECLLNVTYCDLLDK